MRENRCVRRLILGLGITLGISAFWMLACEPVQSTAGDEASLIEAELISLEDEALREKGQSGGGGGANQCVVDSRTSRQDCRTQAQANPQTDQGANTARRDCLAACRDAFKACRDANPQGGSGGGGGVDDQGSDQASSIQEAHGLPDLIE